MIDTKTLSTKQQELINNFFAQGGEHMIKSAIKKVLKADLSDVQLAEYVDIAYLAVCKAARNYNEKKGTKFSTFATTNIKSAIVSQLRYENRKCRQEDKNLKSLEEKDTDDVALHEKVASKETVGEYADDISDEMKSYLNTLSNDAKIVLNYLQDNLSIDAISNKTGFSTKRIKDIIKQLKNEKRLHILKKGNKVMKKERQCKENERNYEIAFSDAESRIEERTIIELLQALKREKIVDTIAIQRDADQWKQKDKSLLIHTILLNLSILPISLTQHRTGAGATQYLTDGKQRLSVLRQYRDNEFALSKTTPPIRMRRAKTQQKLDENGEPMFKKVGSKKVPVMENCYNEDGEQIIETFDYNIAGKYYDELPDICKEQFDHYNNMKQIIHINYTDEEFQLQMLRDNTSVKMTPAQTGVVLVGNKLAQWLHDFRLMDLFLNCSTWSEGAIIKSLIERCVIEAFILSEQPERWYANYEKNVNFFKELVTEELAESFKESIDSFGTLLLDYPQLKEHLCYKNLNVIIALYRNFCDTKTQYKRSDFADFLCKWFDEIKDTTEYEVPGGVGSKCKVTILDKLNIITEELEKYLKTCEVSNNNSYITIDESEKLAEMKQEMKSSIFNKEETQSIPEYDNYLKLFVDYEDEDGEDSQEFNKKVFMIANGCAYDDIDEQYEEFIEDMNMLGQDDYIKTAENISEQLSEFLNALDSESALLNDEVICQILDIYASSVVDSPISDGTFACWLNELENMLDETPEAEINFDNINKSFDSYVRKYA